MNRQPTIADDELPPLTPEMEALPTDRQRKFVHYLFEAPPRKRGRIIWAARAAGFGNPDGSSTNKALSVIAARLLGNDRIQRALQAESQRRLRALPPAAVAALERLVDDPTHRDHARALDMVLARTDPVATTHNVHVDHRHEHHVSDADVEKVRARIAQLAERAGLLPRPIAAPVDAEFRVVEEGGSA